MLSPTQEEKDKLFISDPEYKEYKNMLIKLENISMIAITVKLSEKLRTVILTL